MSRTVTIAGQIGKYLRNMARAPPTNFLTESVTHLPTGERPMKLTANLSADNRADLATALCEIANAITGGDCTSGGQRALDCTYDWEITEEPAVGTVIHATYRPQDLLPAFLSELANRDPAAYAQLVVAPFGPIPAYVQDEGDDSEWWDSDEALNLRVDLEDALDRAAPEGYYFGAHPGDGSDFGYWENEPCEDCGGSGCWVCLGND